MTDIYYWGREDRTLTIYSLKDCANNCPFCISKNQVYHNNMQRNLTKVIENIKFAVTKAKVKNIVISGGEPFADTKSLLYLLFAIYEYKKNYDLKVYINTTLPEKNFQDVLNMFYFLPGNTIDGISVSRHIGMRLKDEVPDSNISILANNYTSVRINCVLTGEENHEQIKEFVERFKGYRINLRKDYRLTENKESMNADEYSCLGLNYVGGCRVCATYATKYENVFVHLGMMNTSERLPINFNAIGEFAVTEINDLIITPDGKLYIDWDISPSNQVTGNIFFTREEFNSKLSRIKNILMELDEKTVTNEEEKVSPINRTDPPWQPFMYGCSRPRYIRNGCSGDYSIRGF